MFPTTTSSSIPPSPSSILPMPSQLFCRSPSATASSMSMNSGCQPSFDFSAAILQLILGQQNSTNNLATNSLLINSSTLLQSLQIQLQIEQQKRQQQQQQIAVAFALQQCIQQLFSSGNSLLLDKEGLEDSSTSLTADGLNGQQKCPIVGQHFGSELAHSQPTDPPDPQPPLSTSSAASTSSSIMKNPKILAQKNGRKRKKLATDEAKNGKEIEGKLEINDGDEEGTTKKQRKRRKRRRLEAETDSPVSGMFITEHWDEAECAKDAQNNSQQLLDESAAFVHVSEAARRTIAQLPNVIGDPCCALCRGRFEDVFRLAMHKCPRIRHTEYRCRECEKVFSCPANLASHRRWHRPAEAAAPRRNNSKNNGENGRNKHKNDGQLLEAKSENSDDTSSLLLMAGKNLTHEAAKALITLGDWSNDEKN